MANSLPNGFELRTAAAESDFDQVRELLREYNQHLFTIIEPSLLSHRVAELDELPGPFLPPRGGFWLATLNGRAAGCVGLRPLALANGELAAECCRMWVARAARGKGLGRILAREAVEAARAQGCAAVYLNTVPETMAAAHRLYLELGFVPTSAYKHVPIPGTRYLRLGLEG